MKVILTLSMKDMKQKTPFSMVIIIKSILQILILLIDLKMDMVVILYMKLLNIEVILVSYQQKHIVLSNVLVV